jgi:calcium-dependent protein kinase
MRNISPHKENGEFKINYTDFVAATLDLRKFLSKEKLWSLFKYFDTKDDGYITADDLNEIFKRHGKVKNYHFLMIC